MKKVLKIFSVILIALITIIAVFGIVIGILNGIAKKIDDSSIPNDGLFSWMSLLKDDTLVKDIVIPGAHDSGSYSMMWAAKTQQREIKDLLSCGVRYFDLREGLKDNKLVVIHGPIKGAEFEPILDNIAEFLTNNPSEFLILDFQHFSNGVEDKVIKFVEEKLSGKLVINDTLLEEETFIANLKLSDCRGKAIIYWGATDNNLNKNYVFTRNNDEGTKEGATLQSYYFRKYNTKTSKKYIEECLPKYISMYKESNVGMFVLQCQLTDPVIIVGPKYYEYKNSDNMDKYISSLSTSEDLTYINIIMRDFFNPSKVVNIVKLNSAKGNVKLDKVNEFNSLVLNPCK